MGKWIFRIAGIVVIPVCAAFLYMVFRMRQYYDAFQVRIIVLFILAAIVAVGAAAWYIFSEERHKGDHGISPKRAIFMGSAVVITIVNSVVYVGYLPKHGQVAACAIVKSDLQLASVEYRGVMSDSPLLLWYEIKGNPFIKDGFVLRWESSDKKTGFVYFNPAGTYEYNFKDDLSIETECFVSSAEKNIYIGQDHVVSMNLYFNQSSRNPLVRSYRTNGNWSADIGIDYATYQPCLSQDDVKAFLGELGEGEIKRQLEECVARYLKYYEEIKTVPMPMATDLTFRIKLYGVDVATYQKGALHSLFEQRQQ